MSFSDPNPNTPLAATTTAQEDLTHAGQRRVNIIWERTQAFIAGAVTVASLAVVSLAIFLPINGPIAMAGIVFVTNLASLVINSYFQRTNHTRVGGVGPKPGEYFGR